MITVTAATEPQVSYIERLLRDRLVTSTTALTTLTEAVRRHRTGESLLAKRFASATIDWLLSQPRKPAVEAPITVTAEPIATLTPGVYGRGDEIFLVKPSKAGHLYAKRLVPISGERLTQAGETAKFEFDYAPGVVKTLRVSDRLSLEAAEKLMLEYGRCICCNRRLKDATSVRMGIGPVCRKQFN